MGNSTRLHKTMRLSWEGVRATSMRKDIGWNRKYPCFQARQNVAVCSDAEGTCSFVDGAAHFRTIVGSQIWRIFCVLRLRQSWLELCEPLVERVNSLASFACPLLRAFYVEGSKEASPTFRRRDATVGRLDS